MILLLMSLAATAACPASATSSDVDLAIEESESAFQALQLDAFQTGVTSVETLVSCAQEVLPVSVVARFHRLEGLSAFVHRDLAAAPLWFAAARALEPDYVLPTALVPVDHPVRALYSQMAVEGRAMVPVDRPADGYILVDGRRATERADGWPVVMQAVDSRGLVWLSAAVGPGQAPPRYPRATTPEPAPQPLPGVATVAEKKGLHRLGVAMIATSASTATLSGATYFLAYKASNDYWATEDPTQLDPLRTRTNGLEAAAIGLGVVAVGAGVTAALTLRW